MRVVGVSGQAEAEMVQGILIGEGIPSLLRGVENPHSLASGRQEVLVPASGAIAAREALLQGSAATPGTSAVPGLRVMACLLAGLALVAIVIAIAVSL